MASGTRGPLLAATIRLKRDENVILTGRLTAATVRTRRMSGNYPSRQFVLPPLHSSTCSSRKLEICIDPTQPLARTAVSLTGLTVCGNIL